MSTSVQNLEEAAHLASEFISSLDNLPLEVQHLLGEIKHMDTRCQELHHEITKNQSRYIKHSLQNASTDGINGGNGKVPDPSLPARIRASYAELDALAAEKLEVAQRLVNLLTITRARLDADLAKVRVLQGELPIPAYDASPAPPSLPAPQQPQLSAVASFVAEQVQEKPPTKKRRVTSARGSPAPNGPSTATPLLSGATAVASRGSTPQARGASGRSRLRRVALPSPETPTPPEEMLVDDEDSAAGGGGVVDEEDEDNKPYCFCHKPSFGDMIGCDNDNCPYQWFHLECVGEKPNLEDKWYCPECRKQGFGDTSNTKATSRRK